MATYIQLRQPFGALDGSRLQTLGSIKNCQNALSVQDGLASLAAKSMEVKSNKRAFSPDTLDEFDSENIDTNVFSSPAKKAKGPDGAALQSSRPHCQLTTTPAASSLSVARKALSLSVPTTANVTPISHSRGSPKHKRVGLLSKSRRASSSPFRRVDPPTYGASRAAALPFNIDAALSGTIPPYRPIEAQPDVPAAAKPAPKSWYFEIHEDTAEDEAANLMEHCASILDISSDDDSETKQRKLESEIGKENVPPPDWTGPASASARRNASAAVHKGIHCKAKAKLRADKARFGDLMQDDRVALADMARADFFPDGLDEQSVEVIAAEDHMSSGVSIEATVDFVTSSMPTNEGSVAADAVAHEIIRRPDSPEKQDA